jgi:hypothetical protein
LSNLGEQRGMSDHGEAGVTTADWMTDAVGFACIEEEHLVGFGDRLALTDVADVGTPVGKDQRSDARVLFSAAVAVCAPAADVADGDAGRVEEEVGGDFGTGRVVGAGEHGSGGRIATTAVVRGHSGFPARDLGIHPLDNAGRISAVEKFRLCLGQHRKVKAGQPRLSRRRED